jgi:hypothetical protein
MEHVGNRRMWNGILVLVMLLAIFGMTGTAQVVFRHPQPGDIYKEYSRTMMEYFEWRVTDPNAQSPYIPDPSYLVNEVLSINIGDLQGAIRAEAVIDLWQGHAGTYGKKMRINDHGWIDIPELTTTPGDGQCYLSQFNVVVDVPLADLVQGTNYFTGTNEGQSCHSFDWGQHGWNGIIFRIYYGSGKAHPTGSITSPSAGSTFGELPSITATASSGSGIQRVDFLAYYDGLDTDGDGIYNDWHYFYHRTKSETNVTIGGHVGTAYNSPYQVTWNTDLVPEQTSGAVKLMARIQDNNGVWFVTDAVENLTLQRSGSNVQMYKSYDVPSNFYVRDYGDRTSHFDVSGDLSQATSARVVLSTWNGISGNIQAGADYYFRVNGWYAPPFGANHFYSLDYLEIPPGELNNGQNSFTIYSESNSTGLFVHWPGPQIVVRFGGDPVPIQLSAFSAHALSASAVRLDWTTLSETNNYGFEVQKSQSQRESFVTLANGFVAGNGTTVNPHTYTFTDLQVTPGVWYYRLKQIDLDASVHYTEPVTVNVVTDVDELAVPVRSNLDQNYPNPFNPSTVIRYALTHRTAVKLVVFNTLGQLVATLFDGEQGPGYHEARFDAAGLPGGVYFYRITADDFTQTKKLTLLR